MERRGPQEIHLHVVWRQVVASGQPGLIELHGPVGVGEQPATKPDFHMNGDWDNADRVARRHNHFNGSGDIAIPFSGWLLLMPVKLDQFADRDGPHGGFQGRRLRQRRGCGLTATAPNGC
jgi:hypothetical protein